MKPDAKFLNIAFIHPNLGLGGAERWLVDAALGLQELGHRVSVYTSQYDPNRSFATTRNGKLDIRVKDSIIPSHLGQRLRAPCAIARMMHLCLSNRRELDRFDIIICDLVSHTLPLLRRLIKTKILFYCHYPDKLLTHDSGLLYRLYRRPINRLELKGLQLADTIAVNSRFTAEQLQRTFPGIKTRNTVVLHPGINCRQYENIKAVNHESRVFLTIGRFAPGKNLTLALQALLRLRELLPPALFADIRLIYAGSVDPNSPEQGRVYQQLKSLVAHHQLQSQVDFISPCSEQQYIELLSRCLALLYTPSDEHFGLVPLEAMAAARPVIACNSGGPLETIIDGTTGYLRPAQAAAFAQAMISFIGNPANARQMGLAGRKHVQSRFQIASFSGRLNTQLQEMLNQESLSAL